MSEDKISIESAPSIVLTPQQQERFDLIRKFEILYSIYYIELA